MVAVGTDLLALALMVPPGDMGADIVVGNAQRFGVPLGYGGPHAAFFATREAFVRQAPGRIIGVSVDSQGRPAYRMALQTREQHIRREKATSNICTAQALLANISAFYAVYHGPDGLTAIASRVHEATVSLADTLAAMGVAQANRHYFDTVRIDMDDEAIVKVRQAAEARGINFRYPASGVIQISLNETVTEADLRDVVAAFGDALDAGAEWRANGSAPQAESKSDALPPTLRRRSSFLTHPVFNTHHSETEMMRYIRSLERKDIGLDTAHDPARVLHDEAECRGRDDAGQLAGVLAPAPVRARGAGRRVPAGVRRARGGAGRNHGLAGRVACSRTPARKGSSRDCSRFTPITRPAGQAHRNIVLIPQSAHGTNPASASMAGLGVVVVACDAQGNIDIPDLRTKASAHRDRLSCLMVTYPSTHGVFEGGIREVCAIVHEHGGQVYMDGANMNAQVGLTSPATIGADVCHLNLHKTFAIPHGGGGPGWARSPWRSTWPPTCRATRSLRSTARSTCPPSPPRPGAAPASS